MVVRTMTLMVSYTSSHTVMELIPCAQASHRSAQIVVFGILPLNFFFFLLKIDMLSTSMFPYFSHSTASWVLQRAVFTHPLGLAIHTRKWVCKHWPKLGKSPISLPGLSPAVALCCLECALCSGVCFLKVVPKLMYNLNGFLGLAHDCKSGIGMSECKSGIWICHQTLFF